MHARAWRRYRQSCECAIRSTLILGMPYLGGMACLSAVPREAYCRSFACLSVIIRVIKKIRQIPKKIRARITIENFVTAIS